MDDYDREMFKKLFPDQDFSKTFEDIYKEEKDKIVYGPKTFEDDKVPTPLLWEDLDKKEYPEQSWRIKGILPKEGTVILASISGQKKTWIAIEMARCLSMGIPFLGEEKYATEGCNVLYLNCENSESEMQRRGRQLGLSANSPYKFHLINHDDINLNSDEGAIWLSVVADYYDISVIFIDTFRAVAGGLKEEKAEEVRTFFKRFGKLKNKEVLLVLLDHHRKPNNLDGKVPKMEHLLGSQDKAASIEVLLMIKSENGSEEIDFYQRKNRLAPEIKPFKIMMKDSEDEGPTLTKLTYAGELEDQENKKEEAKELVYGMLENGGKRTKDILELIKKQVGSKNTRLALAELVHENLIECKKEGRENYYFIPEEKGQDSTINHHIEENDLFSNDS